MDKTVKLYYESAYMQEFSARVLKVVEHEGRWHVALDKTCFYPGGGGQPADNGILGGVQVLDCYAKNGIIYHILEDTHGFAVGDEVVGKINFARRYAFMQNHTGEHILSGLAKSCFGATNVGFHMSERGFTMDLDMPLDKAALDGLERLANQVIHGGLMVDLRFLPGHNLRGSDMRSKRDFANDDTVRLVTIGKYDLCACAGLHTENTHEVGVMQIVSHQNYKGGVRLTVFCGIDAAWDYGRKNAIVQEFSRKLSAETDSCIFALERYMDGAAALREEIAMLKNRVFELYTSQIADNVRLVWFFEDGLTVEDIRRFASMAAERAQIAVVLSKQDKGHKYAICTQNTDVDLVDFARRFNDVLDGKGGAKNQVAQGSISANYSAILAYLEGLV